MAELFEGELECAGECGARIRLVSRMKRDTHLGTFLSLAETLGWKTVTVKQKTHVFCAFCQERAELISKGQ